MIRFLLDDEAVTLRDAPADLTVLDWLRLHRARTGTKEGCGSGDCGACTVVVVRVQDDGPAAPTLRYQSINACIAFVGSLHGAQLLSVESLERDNVLHPVQQAMLDEHGSQCGFCTPGFIMSMFALGQADDVPRVRWRSNAGEPGAAASSATAGDSDGESDRRVSEPTPVAESRSPAVIDSLSEAAHADAVITGSHPGASRPLTRPAGWLHGLDVDDPLALSHRIDRALGGNLCRCTGYRPIKRATAISLADGQPWLDEAASHDLIERLQGLRDLDASPAAAATAPATAAPVADSHAGAVTVADGWHRPVSLADLAVLLQSRPDARVVAGATDLALEVTQRVRDLPCLVATAAVPELQILDESDGVLHIGAAVSLSRLEALFADRLPEASRLLLRFGSDPVRNAGTLGGNVCSASPIGDLPPLLLALDATLQLQHGDAVRELAVADFFLDYRRTAMQPGEFLRAVRMPMPGARSRLAIHKISKRMDDDISTVCGAFHWQADEHGVVTWARLAFGGMAAIPQRAWNAEAALVGRRFDAAAAQGAAACLGSDFSPIDDARASAAYRRQVAANLLHRTAIEQRLAQTPTQTSMRASIPAVDEAAGEAAGEASAAPTRVLDLESDYLRLADEATDASPG